MPLELFIERRFSRESLALIERANEIISDYQSQGFTLTLRQLYYQFVSRDLLPNKQSEYKRLGSVINDARLAGLIDWEAIEDRTRNLHELATWATPNDLLDAAAQQYRSNLWDDQEYRVEIWLEKEALVGVIEPACDRWRVPYFACRGYTSQSEQWRAGKRLSTHCDRGQRVLILHLGDHDPSGIDMTRDNADRLAMFAQLGDLALPDDVLEVRRIALNMDQVRRYRPPPNPAKLTDSRFGGYAAKFGEKSWELDALSPTVIDQLIENEIRSVLDFDKWRGAEEREDAERRALLALAHEWKSAP
jgi:hypothetical protein